MTSNWLEERCPRCNYYLQSTRHQGYGYCPMCREYRHAHTPWAGQHWGRMWMPELCKYCGQQIVDTPNPRVNYCPSCGKYQTDRLY